MPSTRVHSLVATALILTAASAAPVSKDEGHHKHAVTTAAASTSSSTTASASNNPGEPKSLREKILHTLSKLSKLLPDAAAGVPMFGSLHKEYDAMTDWWCEGGGKEAAAAFSDSSFCLTRRAKNDPSTRAKGITDDHRQQKMEEAKVMIQHYCKTSQGAETQICIRSIGLVETGKRLFHRVHGHVLNATSDPAVVAARRAAALGG